MANRSQLFHTAWRNARNIAAARSIALRAAFACALRQAWAVAKELARPAQNLAAEASAMIAEIRARKAAGERFGTTKPWRFANAGVTAW